MAEVNIKHSKKIGIVQLVLLIIASCMGIRWIPVAGTMGPPALFFWLLGIFLFFIPLAMMIIELSLNFEEDGGIYLWVKKGLGPRSGFFTAWFYWSCNFFYYPGILTFMAVNFAYLLGMKSLAANSHFIVTVVICSFWLAIFVNILGIQKLAKVGSFAGVLNVFLVIFIIVAGFSYLVIYHTPATTYSLSSIIPHTDTTHNLANLALLMFALSGLELIPTLAHSVKNPERTLPRGLIISAILLIAFYMVGTIAINFILSPAELSNASGLFDAFNAISNKLNLHHMISFFMFAMVVIEFGGVCLWLIAPTVMFFECIEEGIVPNWLHRVNSREIPANALIMQGVLVTLIIVLTQYLPSVNAMYLSLILMAAITYFMPYLFAAVAYYRLRKEDLLERTIFSKGVATVLAALVFISITFGILITFAPGSDIKTSHDIIVYEIELIIGPILFAVMGILLYSFRKQQR